MKLITNLLIKLGILKKNLDYQLIRASMIVIFLFFGYQKWFQYEAQALIPYISHGPLIFWCTLFSASAVRRGFWEFRNGCLGRSCLLDSGTRN